MFYCQKWEYAKGYKVIQEINMNLNVYNNKVRRYKVNKSTRMLGIYSIP